MFRNTTGVIHQLVQSDCGSIRQTLEPIFLTQIDLLLLQLLLESGRSLQGGDQEEEQHDFATHHTSECWASARIRP